MRLRARNERHRYANALATHSKEVFRQLRAELGIDVPRTLTHPIRPPEEEIDATTRCSHTLLKLVLPLPYVVCWTPLRHVQVFQAQFVSRGAFGWHLPLLLRT